MVCTEQLTVTAICLKTNMLNGLVLAVKYGALRAEFSGSSQRAAAIYQACLKVSIADALAFSSINHTNTHSKADSNHALIYRTCYTYHAAQRFLNRVEKITPTAALKQYGKQLYSKTGG